MRNGENFHKAENYIKFSLTILYLPHSAPRDFIMVSTPDLAHALGTTKPDPFKRQIVVTEQGKNIYLIGIVGCDCKENSTTLCFYHPLPHLQCQEGCALSKTNVVNSLEGMIMMSKP